MNRVECLHLVSQSKPFTLSMPITFISWQFGCIKGVHSTISGNKHELSHTLPTESFGASKVNQTSFSSSFAFVHDSTLCHHLQFPVFKNVYPSTLGVDNMSSSRLCTLVDIMSSWVPSFKTVHPCSFLVDMLSSSASSVQNSAPASSYQEFITILY